MLSPCFTPFPTLTTDRLVLRQLTLGDENEIFFLRSDESVNCYVARPKPNSLQDARDHIDKLDKAIENNESILWGISLRSSPTIAGTVCLWNLAPENDTAEIGYDLAPIFQGKGFMHEAVGEVIRYGTEILKVRRYLAWVHHENSHSISLLKKYNFTRDTEEEKVSTDLPGNMVIYSLHA
jgi:[ribosomal protein S5]-alanine N-acetyltransferase